MTDKKVVKLTKVASIAVEPDTYLKCLHAHIDQLSDEQKNAQPICMFIGSLTETGCAYSVLSGDDIAQLIGAIDIIKQYIFFDTIGLGE